MASNALLEETENSILRLHDIAKAVKWGSNIEKLILEASFQKVTGSKIFNYEDGGDGERRDGGEGEERDGGEGERRDGSEGERGDGSKDEEKLIERLLPGEKYRATIKALAGIFRDAQDVDRTNSSKWTVTVRSTKESPLMIFLGIPVINPLLAGIVNKCDDEKIEINIKELMKKVIGDPGTSKSRGLAVTKRMLERNPNNIEADALLKIASPYADKENIINFIYEQSDLKKEEKNVVEDFLRRTRLEYNDICSESVRDAIDSLLGDVEITSMLSRRCVELLTKPSITLSAFTDILWYMIESKQLQEWLIRLKLEESHPSLGLAVKLLSISEVKGQKGKKKDKAQGKGEEKGKKKDKAQGKGEEKGKKKDKPQEKGEGKGKKKDKAQETIKAVVPGLLPDLTVQDIARIDRFVHVRNDVAKLLSTSAQDGGANKFGSEQTRFDKTYDLLVSKLVPIAYSDVDVQRQEKEKMMSWEPTEETINTIITECGRVGQLQEERDNYSKSLYSIRNYLLHVYRPEQTDGFQNLLSYVFSLLPSYHERFAEAADDDDDDDDVDEENAELEMLNMNTGEDEEGGLNPTNSTSHNPGFMGEVSTDEAVCASEMPEQHGTPISNLFLFRGDEMLTGDEEDKVDTD